MCKRKIPLDGSKARCELNADQAKPADIIEAIVPFLESTFAAMYGFLELLGPFLLLHAKKSSRTRCSHQFFFSPNISNMSKPIFKKIMVIFFF